MASASAARVASASSQIRWLNRIKGPGNRLELDEPEPLLWGSGWCARTPAYLKQNMARIDVRLLANGERIDAALYAVRDYGSEDPANPTYCRSTYVLIDAWPLGTSVLTVQYTRREVINDGWRTYPPGVDSVDYFVVLRGGQGF